MKKSKNVIGWIYLLLALIFVLGPIIITMIFSFNTDRFSSPPWREFTFKWYVKAFTNKDVLNSLKNSLLLGIAVSFTSICLGFTGAFGLRHWRSKAKGAVELASLSPLAVPWTLLGLALLIFFNKIGFSKSLFTVWISHVVLTAPMALSIINNRMKTIPKSMEDAAWDLGANDVKTLIYVLLPQLAPALAAAALLTFTISFDEFIIAWFVCGFTQTLPVYIYGIIRSGVTPVINAIGSVVFCFSITLVSISQAIQHKSK